MSKTIAPGSSQADYQTLLSMSQTIRNDIVRVMNEPSPIGFAPRLLHAIRQEPPPAQMMLPIVNRTTAPHKKRKNG